MQRRSKLNKALNMNVVITSMLALGILTEYGEGPWRTENSTCFIWDINNMSNTPRCSLYNILSDSKGCFIHLQFCITACICFGDRP